MWTKHNRDSLHQRRAREAGVRRIREKMRANPNRVGMQLRGALSRMPCESVQYEYETKDDEGNSRWYSACVRIRGKDVLIDAFTPRVGGGIPNEEKARRRAKVAWCKKHGIPYLAMSINNSQKMELAIRDYIRRLFKNV